MITMNHHSVNIPPINTHDHLKKPSGSGCPCNSFYIFQHMLIPAPFRSEPNLVDGKPNQLTKMKARYFNIGDAAANCLVYCTSKLQVENKQLLISLFLERSPTPKHVKNSQRGTFQKTIKSRVNSFPRLRELETINSRCRHT